MVILAETILPDFEDQAEEATLYPSDGTVLLRIVAALVLVIWMLEDLPCLFETNPSPRVFLNDLLFAMLNLKRMAAWYNCYTIRLLLWRTAASPAARRRS